MAAALFATVVDSVVTVPDRVVTDVDKPDTVAFVAVSEFIVAYVLLANTDVTSTVTSGTIGIGASTVPVAAGFTVTIKPALPA